ncbi:MAG: hypothetical protein HXX08_14505 [Chloroflexi bacterium]|uniref:Uncharacterized protein n=1 Tax=Candidatus Chlorohelix allophototropha TaxID=3003348 RepID=A0A8T7M4S5_9CHLR|nr:hypothetical protein [Chloroflexota bacterium]WJW70383.1 hypothetical protein OZ401_004957 [Chloroflexota bacterium L227-S17]
MHRNTATANVILSRGLANQGLSLDVLCRKAAVVYDLAQKSKVATITKMVTVGY